MPLNQNNTVIPEGTVVRFINGEGMIMQEQRMPVGEDVQYFVDETTNIHRAEPYVRLNLDTETTVTANHTVVNEELLRQLVGDFGAGTLYADTVDTITPWVTAEQAERNTAGRNNDYWWARTAAAWIDGEDIELADVDPDEFDKILSA